MRTVEQAPDRLIVHDSPWGVRAMGALLAALGGAVLVIASSAGRDPGPGGWIAYLVGGAFVIVGVATVLTAGDCRLIFDGPGMIVRVVRRGVFGATAVVYPFASIRDIALEVSGTGRGVRAGGFYRSVFVLRDGSRVPWTSAATGDFGSQAQCVATARAFGGWDTTSTGAASARASSATEPRRPTPLAAMPAVSFPGDPPRAASPTRMQNAKLVGVVLGAFVVIGLAMTGTEAEHLMVWRPVAATVATSTVQAVPAGKGATTYRPLVTYQYAVNGRHYASTRVTVLTVSHSYDWAQSMSSRYVPGSTTTAYVNPHDPTRSYLVHEISLLPLCITLIPALFGAIFLYGTRWQDRQAALAARVNVPILLSSGSPTPTPTPAPAPE